MAIAFITGTGSGIGLATAVTLARAGHQVVATMRSLDSAGALRKLIDAEKLPVTVAALDVDDDASVAKAFAQALAAHGHIDILVNNAGVPGGVGSVEEMPLSLYRKTMETNFFGGLRCIKAVVPGMRERRSGCIVNVTSVAGRLAMSPQSAYAASKYAFEAMSECLAQEMKAFNVRVVIIEPGVIATPIFGKVPPMPANSPYPQGRRTMARFRAALAQPVSPFVVGEKIRDIVHGDSWQLRYPVGPDAAPLLAWRAGTADEEVVRQTALSDADWVAMMKRERGLDIVL